MLELLFCYVLLRFFFLVKVETEKNGSRNQLYDKERTSIPIPQSPNNVFCLFSRYIYS